jgi:pimeloyl-ACP methyl ester carboxylesterase
MSAPILLLTLLMTPATHAGTVTIAPGVDLYYEEAGKGLPIVFVPGWTLSGEVFVHQVESLAPHYRTIVVDPRGQGRSRVRSLAEMDHNTYVQHGRDLAALVTKLDLPPFVLVGWSYGCLDAYAYVRAVGSGRLRGFVCIDQTPIPLRTGRAGEWAERGIEDKRTFFNDANYDRARFTRAFAQWMVERPLRAGEIEWLSRMSLATPTAVAILLASDALFSNYAAELAQIARAVPTLYVERQDEAQVALPWLRTNVPQAQTFVLGKHMMFWERPAEFNRALEGFLRESKLR